MIRRAIIPDIPDIGRIINDCAERGLMLHRSLAYLYEHMRDFLVAEDQGDGQHDGHGKDQGVVVGVCGLRIEWASLAEVYALAVTPSHRGRGVGKQLVAASVEEAKQLGVPKLMTLTYEKRFFEACGFEVVDRNQLPLKVWSECLRCSKNQACDEIAMVRVLTDVPVPDGPKPSPPPKDQYVVPVTLSMRPGRLDHRTKMDNKP